MKAKLYDELRQKANRNSKDTALPAGDRAFWARVGAELDKLEAAARKTRYAALGVYDQGEPVTPKKHDRSYQDCFLDCTMQLAFIKAFHGQPIKSAMGLEAWPPGTCDYDVMSVDDPACWEALYSNGWLDWKRPYSDADGPLRYALKSPYITNPAVWDYLYKLFPNERLADMFWHAPTLAAVKWLDQAPHRADRCYDGLRCSMEQAVASRRFPDTPEIMRYLYNKTIGDAE